MLITILVFLPLLGFALNGLYHFSNLRTGSRASPGVSGFVATSLMGVSFLAAVLLFWRLSALGEGAVIEETLFSWMKLGALSVDFGFRFDRLSAIFTLVITGVGTLIHAYSVGYMHEDAGVARYFAYLNLFCFMMLNLVLGQTMVQVFLGWEGVGLASYLLIGFWYADFTKVLAAQKAFVMNRIGDLGFLLAIFVGFKYAGTLDLSALSKVTLAPGVVTVFGLMVFLACTGKSAQLPLFTWLPDAMAGPTPVSALIHAATMVTSGIYLLARLHPVISASPTVIWVVASVGALTALMAAITACFQSDIKKILAYSTISQLGFMFVAVGVGSTESGVFHVMTHAFFKALLFLGAGSVIHACSGEQDIFKMGGLRKALPVTFMTFLAGWAAILGLPPLSGFFSKDEIIHAAIAGTHGHPLIFGVLLLTALLTAFYMTRMLVLVFFGEMRLSGAARGLLHESPGIMTVPLVVLALASLAGGWFGAPIHFGEHAGSSVFSASGVMVLSVGVAIVGALIAWRRYARGSRSEYARDPIGIDRFYSFAFGRGVPAFAQFLGRFVEDFVVQRTIQVSGALVELSGNFLRVVQTGSVQGYLLLMMMVLLAAVVWFGMGWVQYGNI